MTFRQNSASYQAQDTFFKKKISLVAFKSSRKHYFFFKKIKIFTFSRKKVFYQKELHEKG